MLILEIYRKCGMFQALLLFGFCQRRCLSRLKRFTLLLLHVKNPLFLSGFMKLELSSQIFEKYSNIKFQENQSSCSMWLDGQKDMTKLIIAFCNFAYASKNEICI